MGVYVVTGGTGGIGAKTMELLAKEGHEVINVDRRRGHITADLSTPEGRQEALDQIQLLHPEGLDGLVCCAGVAGDCCDLKKILSLNFFGTISMVKGLYPLLKKKQGACVVISSNAISQGDVRMDIADLLNNHNDNEQRILNLVSHMNKQDTGTGNSIYIAGKYALARWMRRHSASYAANGVRINAVAPGNVNASMAAIRPGNANMSGGAMRPGNANVSGGAMRSGNAGASAAAGRSAREEAALNALPIPTKFNRDTFMQPSEIASAITFLLSPAARGINGVILFVDGGTDALLNTEKVY